VTLTGSYPHYSREVAIGEVSKFDLRRIESGGLPGGKLADEEAVTDVLRNGLYQEQREAVRDPDPHAVANFWDCRLSGELSKVTCPDTRLVRHLAGSDCGAVFLNGE
jgi:hypothetical protein